MLYYTENEDATFYIIQLFSNRGRYENLPNISLDMEQVVSESAGVEIRQCVKYSTAAKKKTIYACFNPYSIQGHYQLCGYFLLLTPVHLTDQSFNNTLIHKIRKNL